jgi:hypothetical protein
VREAGGSIGARRGRPWVVLLGVLALSACAAAVTSTASAPREGRIMRVTFERSGGFTGIPRSASVDAAALSADDARTLERLVGDANFLALPKRIGSASRGADRFTYRVTVEPTGAAAHTVEVAEDQVPPSLRPLLDWLGAKAAPGAR